MKTIIRSVKIISKQSPFNGKVKSLLIENGIIKKIADNIPSSKADKVIEGKDICVSGGWFDMKANFREPGLEYKEDLMSGCKAAMISLSFVNGSSACTAFSRTSGCASFKAARSAILTVGSFAQRQSNPAATRPRSCGAVRRGAGTARLGSILGGHIKPETNYLKRPQSLEISVRRLARDLRPVADPHEIIAEHTFSSLEPLI